MAEPLKFGGMLKLLRRAKGLSIPAAEKKSGMRLGRWEELEEAEHEPRVSDFLRALRTVGCRDHTVFDPDEDFRRRP